MKPKCFFFSFFFERALDFPPFETPQNINFPHASLAPTPMGGGTPPPPPLREGGGRLDYPPAPLFPIFLCPRGNRPFLVTQERLDKGCEGLFEPQFGGVLVSIESRGAPPPTGGRPRPPPGRRCTSRTWSPSSSPPSASSSRCAISPGGGWKGVLAYVSFAVTAFFRPLRSLCSIPSRAFTPQWLCDRPPVLAGCILPHPAWRHVCARVRVWAEAATPFPRRSRPVRTQV